MLVVIPSCPLGSAHLLIVHRLGCFCSHWWGRAGISGDCVINKRQHPPPCGSSAVGGEMPNAHATALMWGDDRKFYHDVLCRFHYVLTFYDRSSAPWEVEVSIYHDHEVDIRLGTAPVGKLSVQGGSESAVILEITSSFQRAFFRCGSVTQSSIVSETSVGSFIPFVQGSITRRRIPIHVHSISRVWL